MYFIIIFSNNDIDNLKRFTIIEMYDILGTVIVILTYMYQSDKVSSEGK